MNVIKIYKDSNVEGEKIISFSLLSLKKKTEAS